ncbi:SERTA domain-containing protein 3 [Paramarasmius palmivorus]|uniref:SERTA domain-containing protein 3 n=1 Tax=Paramarasmius palmivorus TaxID=297713 RepID=A0AAW0BB83_9AGAR
MSAPNPSRQSALPNDASDTQPSQEASSITDVPTPSPIESQPVSGTSPSFATADQATSNDSSSASQDTDSGSKTIHGASTGSPAPEKPDELSGEVDVDEEPEEDSGKRGRGKPSNFTGARLVAMENGLKRYMELKSKKEKTQFWPLFMSELMEQFPVSKYPIPASRLAGREEFEEKSAEDIKAMTPKQREAYQRSARQASATDEELYLQMVKDWIFWKQNMARKSEGGMTAALLKAELEKKKKQVKPQFNQFVMKHPDYKGRVVDRSSETGCTDRLPKRAQAVKDLLEDIPAEELEALKGEYNELVEALDEDVDEDEQAPPDVAAQRARRKNFGSLAQDVLNIWRKLTGLNLVLLAGECMDGEADYDSCVIFSKPDGCPDMDAGEGVDFDRFSNTFLHWLKDIYARTHPDDLNKQSEASDSRPSNSIATPGPSLSAESTPAPQLMPELPTRSDGNDIERSRPKKGKIGSRRAQSRFSDDDTPEPSEPSDIGSESEDEGEGDVISPVPAKIEAPVNSDGLWERNEEGLPVLKVPMCDLTREQQAAFTREFAVAIGLTKAVEELQEDISKSARAKKGATSKYKGMKPTRKSSRIQTSQVVNDMERSDGNVTGDEQAPTNDEQGILGEEADDVQMGDGVPVSPEKVNDISDSTEHVLRSVDNVDVLPSWAKTVVMGYSELDIPTMEAWGHFNVQGCSTAFLKDYGGWLLGPNNVQHPSAWSALVYKWIEVEEEWNQRNVSTGGPQIKMLKNRRPQGFLQWFKYGRLRWEALVPSEVCAETLGHEWWVWWSKVVNPRWRPKSDDMVMPGGQGSWEAVRIPGKDGFILALVALRWWCDLLDRPEQDLLWVSTVKAVFWTLEELLKDARTNLDADSDSDQHEEEQIDSPQNGKAAVETSGQKRKG